MGNKSKGLNSGEKLMSRRKHGLMLDKVWIRRNYNLKAKCDPLEGASQARAIVLEKVEVEAPAGKLIYTIKSIN